MGINTNYYFSDRLTTVLDEPLAADLGADSNEFLYSSDSIHRDYNLLMECSTNELDVEYGQLVKMNWLHKLVALIWNKGRTERLINYTNFVCNKIDKFGLTHAKQRVMYMKFKEWNIPTSLRKTIDSLQKNVDQILRTSLEDANLALEIAHGNFKIALENFNNQPNQSTAFANAKNAKIALNIKRLEQAEADVALNGRQIATGRSANCAKFLLGANNKKRLVVKTKAKDDRSRASQESFWLSPKGLMQGKKIYMKTQTERLNYKDMRQAGAVAFKFSELFDFDLLYALVPPTKTNEDGHLLQLFEENAVLADDTEVQRNTKFTSDLQANFHAFALFDIALHNLDRLPRNWMFKIDQQRQIVRPIAIDNDNILSENELNAIEDWNTNRKMFAWSSEWWANQLVDRRHPKLQQIINNMRNEQMWQQFINASNAQYPGFFSAKRSERFKDNMRVLNGMIENHTLADIAKFLNTNNNPKIKVHTSPNQSRSQDRIAVMHDEINNKLTESGEFTSKMRSESPFQINLTNDLSEPLLQSQN